MAKLKHRWLDRRISAPGPYLCLVTTDDEWANALDDLGVKDRPHWIATPQADATTHSMPNHEGKLSAIVCICGFEGREPVEVAGLLIHEAVHVWQAWCNYYGERRPGDEQEAYAIQSIAQELMAEFARLQNRS